MLAGRLDLCPGVLDYIFMKCKTVSLEICLPNCQIRRLETWKSGVNADNAASKRLNIARYAYKLIYVA